MSASEMQTMLADARNAGAMLVSQDDLPDLHHAAQLNGLLCKRVDLAGCRSKLNLLDRIAHVLQFPKTFGRNWDALSDCLGDLSWLPAKGYWIEFAHAAELRKAAPEDFDTLMSVLDDAAVSLAARKIAFWSAVALPDALMDALDDDAVD
ncbi:MAG TPA: barstar family protein [Xanthomonadaceae bacterium]|nr:barstar family protein [Xanthomonadaceae bacterium]